MSVEFNIKSGNPEKQRSGAVVIGVFEGKKLSLAAHAMDRASGRAITALCKSGDMDGKLGQCVTLHNLPNTFAERTVVVGLGREKAFTETRYHQVTVKATRSVLQTGSRELANFLTTLPVKGRDENWAVQQAVIAHQEALYRFTQMKSSEPSERKLRSIILSIESRKTLAEAEAAAAKGQAIANGVSFAKDLGNLPGNICNPTYLAEQAIELAQAHSDLDSEILEEADMAELGMGSLLSVSRGSRQPAKLIVMKYNGGEQGAKPYALVGKGLTFDAGGISIKPASGMDEMKYDMCGGASVFGAMKAACELQLPINIVAVVPASENLPDGDANKPGDIVTTMAGKTVEVLNTDAEGRLILCDALTYTERFDPETVIDVATLTGACVVALGEHATAMYVNDRGMARKLSNAADTSGDRIWEMPLWDDYQQQLKSNFADMANIGGPKAGSITAACFLARFTEKFNWAHLDIAGTAWKSGAAKGATGRPVPLLTQFLIDRAEQA